MNGPMILALVMVVAQLVSPLALVVDAAPMPSPSACCCESCVVHSAQRSPCACAPANVCNVVPTLAILSAASALRSPESVQMDFSLVNSYAATRSERPASPPPKVAVS